MATLQNPKYELFAQALAKGATQEKAYEEAGYKPDRGAASRLSTNIIIRCRVAEIQAGTAAIAEITIGDLVDQLEEARVKAINAKVPQINAAISAIMGKAKLLGFDGSKGSSHGKNFDFEVDILKYLNDSELIELEKRILKELEVLN